MAAFSYMLLLFFIAYATDQGWVSDRITKHPLTFSLSLGVYATTWTYYGSVGFAEEQGYNFLTIYIGVTFAFILAPLVLLPILRLTHEYQLTSLADLLSFRYRSQLAGIAVTLFMLVGVLPYLALQIRAVTESIYILTEEASPELLALGFCVSLTVFAILFGARHVTAREKHQGLVVAIAFESAIKLLALLSVGLVALLGVWGGLGGLTAWLESHPEALTALYRPVKEGPWNTLLLLSFAAAFLLPRQFHMIFTENDNPYALSMAAWIFPLILLLLNLPIPIVLWAGQILRLDMPADYYVLGVSLAEGGRSPLPVLAFIGGISAASAMMIVTTLALASMCLNHLLLPASYPDPSVDLYRWLLWGRRTLIAMIVMAAYGFYRLLEHNQGLVQLGLISFVAVAQFLPGIVGVLYWRRATRTGFLAGLMGGIAVWVVTLVIPLLEASHLLTTDFGGLQAIAGQSKWVNSTFWSLTVNGVLFVGFSLLSAQRPEERTAAEACCMETVAPLAGVVAADSAAKIEQQLAQVIGRETATQEINQALADLNMSPSTSRPTDLQRLRDQLERNLSGLVGPQLAHMVVSKHLKLATGARVELADTMRFVEARLEDSRSRLRGLAAELDVLRRYHKQILLDLPLGVCALSPKREVVLWNFAMEVLSGVKSGQAVGNQLHNLPQPWGRLLNEFAATQDNHLHRLQIEVAERMRWVNLHKANIMEHGNVFTNNNELSLGSVILLEDLTDLETLETELAHSERLASIGRLAAGVAHEIGNPVTGIACLAQNLRHENDPAEIDASARQILDQTKRISKIVQSLVTFSHSGTDSYVREAFNLHEAIAEAIQLVHLSHRGRQVNFTQDCPDGSTLCGDRQRLIQVFVNLLTNACDACEAGGVVDVMVEPVDDVYRIEIRDQGKGISEKDRERIFEPFFTTKKPGEGTGLGLSLVYKIVQDHHGDIDIESEAGRGTRVIIALPMGEQACQRHVL